MSNRKVKKAEGGHKKGHSNMCHWMGTEEIKAAAKVVRRQEDKKTIRYCTDKEFREASDWVMKEYHDVFKKLADS